MAQQPPARILVLFHSTYGHVHQLADAVAGGCKDVVGVEVYVKRVPETLPPEVLEQMGAREAQKRLESVPIASPLELPIYDAIIVGSPTRFGTMTAQMKAFWDATAALWSTGALVGKVGGAFVSTGTQHGGNETTVFSVLTTLMHHGMLLAGLPYTFRDQQTNDAIHGCSPYGASTIAGGKADLKPTAVDLAGARYQGRYIATMALRLALTKHMQLVFPQPEAAPLAAAAAAAAATSQSRASAPAGSPAAPPASSPPSQQPGPDAARAQAPAQGAGQPVQGQVPQAGGPPPLNAGGAGGAASSGGGDIFQKR